MPIVERGPSLVKPWAKSARARHALVASLAKPSSRVRRYGPFALALFLLATSRWGSHLVPGPPFIADIILGLLLIDHAIAAWTGRLPHRGTDPWLGMAAGALLTWSAINLLFSPLSQDALRDAAPYLYAVILFLVPPLSDRAERIASRAVTAALVFHAAWVTLSHVAPSPLPFAPSLDEGQAYVFEVRSDFDSTACGLLAVIALNRVFQGRSPILNLALMAWGTALVLTLGSRAGFLAFVAQLAVLTALLLRARVARVRGRRPRWGLAPTCQVTARRLNYRIVVAGLVLLIPVAAITVRGTGTVSELTALLALDNPARETQEAGAGTARARLESWGHLAEWIAKDPGRNIGGVGVGPDFLKKSRSATLLLGESPVAESRHPHNYFLNTWARFGLIGLALTLATLGAGLRLVVLIARRSPALRDTDLLAILVLVSLPLAAAFGVILESPFGAIPYFWALGHLSARACQLGAATPLAALIGRAGAQSA